MRNAYHAYMLRVWKVGEGEGAMWRASLEDPHSGDYRSFASLELLMSFLQEIDGIQGRPAAISNTVVPITPPA